MNHVGTSGFSYQHWKELFYPKDVPQRRWLEFYAEHFDCVEINSSFYHLPAEKTMVSWQKRAPDGFLFALKASRYITHIKRLKDCEDAVNLFYKRARLLGEKLGPVLWQVPPRFKKDMKRLESFLDLLTPDPIPVLEFRDPSWFTQDVYDLLESKGSALCVHDMPASQCPEIAVGSILYLRFHGPGDRYQGSYSDAMLRERARWAKHTGRTDIYAFFNNDVGAHAVRNAEILRKHLERKS